MLTVHAVTAAGTDQWVGAGVAIAASLAALWLIRLVFFTPRTRKLAEAVLRGELNPEVDTRLRLLERAVYALVIVTGIAIALSQFDGVRTLGHALLTSGAITAAIVGFAARQTLANVIAGLMIAVAQPVRLGDHVGFEDYVGVVEDVTLSYTTLRTGSGVRIVIPNEKLTAGVLRNESLVDPPVKPEVSLWIAPDADAARAVTVLAEATDAAVSVAESTPEGIRLSLSAAAVAPPDRPGREAELRAAGLARLHAEGLLRRA
jgi:small-conductance mechanosensitive channel